MPEHLDPQLELNRKAFSGELDSIPEVDQYVKEVMDRANALAESRRIDPKASSEEQFHGLVRNLRGSMEEGMVSFFDSDATLLYDFLINHPELSGSPEELDARLDVLNTLVGAAWKAPGSEEALERLRNPRLGPSGSHNP